MDDPNREWEAGWAGHERRQMERLARLPLPEKLAWLEEAQRLVLLLDSRSDGPGEAKPGPSR